jgi:hypothetical protein
MDPAPERPRLPPMREPERTGALGGAAFTHKRMSVVFVAVFAGAAPSGGCSSSSTCQPMPTSDAALPHHDAANPATTTESGSDAGVSCLAHGSHYGCYANATAAVAAIGEASNGYTCPVGAESFRCAGSEVCWLSAPTTACTDTSGRDAGAE